MKAAPLQSPSLEKIPGQGLRLLNLSFLGNGPYSITVIPGGCLGLTGKSGVGKTQLLRAVADVIPHDGECILDADVCSSVSPPIWRKMVAMLPAESFWWYDSVGAHFNGGLLQPEFKDLMERLGFSQDVMEWQVSRLSTGERQRLSLIRTLINRPRVLLLDEPTSALDKKMVAVVEEIIADIRFHRQISCIWVSHDRDQLFRVADTVCTVETTGLVKENQE